MIEDTRGMAKLTQLDKLRPPKISQPPDMSRTATQQAQPSLIELSLNQLNPTGSWAKQMFIIVCHWEFVVVMQH